MYSDCWAVSFANCIDAAGRCVIGAYENGNLNVYDLRNLNMVASLHTEHPICSLDSHRKTDKLQSVVGGTRQGSLQLYKFDNNTNQMSLVREEVCAVREPERKVSRTVWCIRHLPQNSDVFGTCDGTGSLRLWSCHKDGFMQTAELQIDSAAVNSFDWHPNRIGLAACSLFNKKINVICTANLQGR